MTIVQDQKSETEQSPPGQAIIAMPAIPGINTITAVKELARLAAESGMSKATNPYDAFFIAMYGMELGIPPMTALRTIYSVKGGPPTCSGEAMLSLLRRSGKVRITLPDPGKITDSATITIERLDSGDKGSFTFTMEMARRADLAGGNVWRKYPHMMLMWRAVSMGAKALCSDIIGGLYTVEEIYPHTPLDENGEPVGDIIEGHVASSDNEQPKVDRRMTLTPVNEDGIKRILAELGIPTDQGKEPFQPYLDALNIDRFGAFSGTQQELDMKLRDIHHRLHEDTPNAGADDAPVLASTGDMMTALQANFEGLQRSELLKAVNQTWDEFTTWAAQIGYDEAYTISKAALEEHFAATPPAEPKSGKRRSSAFVQGDTPTYEWTDYDIHDIEAECETYGSDPGEVLLRLGKPDWREFSSASVAKKAIKADVQAKQWPVKATKVTRTATKHKWVFHTPIGEIGFFGRDVLRDAYEGHTNHLATVETWADQGEYTLPIPLMVSWEQKGQYKNATAADICMSNVPF